MLSISSLSREFLYTDVTSDADPTGFAVSFAFSAVGAEPEAFYAGSWEQPAVQTDGTYKTTAKTLIGPGTSFELANGTYDCWVKIVATPEAPVRKFDTIVVT